MSTHLVLGVIVMITLGIMVTTPILILQPADAYKIEQINGPGAIATSGDNAYVTWASNKTGNWEVLFRASADNGDSFGDKINLSNSSNGHSGMEEIAASGENVFVTYGDNKTGSMETFMRRSTDGGETFGDAVVLNSTGTGQLTGTQQPSRTTDVALQTVVAASGDNTYVTWYDNKTGNWEIMFARSTDRGETFVDTVNLSNSTEHSDEAIMHADGENVFVHWWERDNIGKSEPVLRVSNDNGATFGEVLKLATNGTLGEAPEEEPEEGE